MSFVGDDVPDATAEALRALCRASRTLARPLSTPQVPGAIAGALVAALADAAAVDVWSEGRWRRAVVRRLGGAAPTRPRPGASPLAANPAGLAAMLDARTAQDGAELVARQPQAGATADEADALAALVHRLGRPLVGADGWACSRGLLVVPLRLGGRPLGLATLWRRAPEASWPEADRHAAQLLADQGASSLELAALATRAACGAQQTRVRATQLTFLHQAAEAFGHASRLDDVLDVLTRLGVAQLAHGCAVELSGDPDQRRTLVAHVDPARQLPLARFVQRACPRRPQPADGVERGADAAGPGALRLPLSVRGVVRGTATFWREGRKARFDADEAVLASALVARAGEAIDRVWRTTEIEQVSRVRDEFLRVASHELRTPLAALQLQLTGLRRSCRRDGADAASVQERAERALQQIGRLAHLTDSLLDAARSSGGPDRLALRRRRRKLAQLCRRVLARVGPEAARRGCPLSLQVDDEVSASVDAAQLARALHHLLVNAVKYGARKPVELHLSRRGRWAVLQVCDHGIGVASHARPRIFGRYERAVSGRTFGGLGLGLYLARRVVAAHGGTIRVRGQIGGGAAFLVLLPLAKKSERSLRVAPPLAAPPD